MADSNLNTIKKIRTTAGDHLIDATFLGGYTFDDIRGMVQGVAGTYVIPTTNSNKDGYDDVVKSTESTQLTTKSILNGLTGYTESYKIGDIILMEELSDGIKVFDRWISAIDGDNITLAVLETQVATHHHTIDVNKGAALTGVSKTVTTLNAIPTVGAAVTVLDGNDAPTVITSVEHDNNGGHNFVLSSESGDGSVSHSHTVESHNHSIRFTPNDLVNSNVDVYTSLSTDKYTPHTHTTTSVAGLPSDDDVLTYATGGGSTDTFVKTLKDSQLTTGGASSTTDDNTVGLSTSAQKSTDTVGNDIKTTSVSSHTHSTEVETEVDVVTDVTLATNVISTVSLDYVAPTVQEDVMVDIECTSANVLSSATVTPTSSSFMNGCSVDENGVLSFSNGSALTDVNIDTTNTSVVSGVTAVTAEQTAGSASLIKTTSSQSFKSSKVKSTGSTSANGEHSHGFSHTHAIPAHSHTMASHAHTYNKSVVDVTGSAYTSLSTGSYTPHTHESVNVIANATAGTEFTYVTGGTTSSVVKDLKGVNQSYTTTDATPKTDTKYVKLSGDIIFPGLTLGTKTLSTTTVTPAVAGTEKPLTSITFTSDDFITSVSDKTSVNIGGDGKANE